MALNREAKYPSRRTCVLKANRDAKPDALAGRLENLVTGRHCEFASSRELPDSIAGDFEEGSPAVVVCRSDCSRRRAMSLSLDQSQLDAIVDSAIGSSA